jgi:drug/metabolite transporter (DMT)-like permease
MNGVEKVKGALTLMFACFMVCLNLGYALADSSASPTSTVTPIATASEFSFLQNPLIPLLLIGVPVVLVALVVYVLFKRKD